MLALTDDIILMTTKPAQKLSIPHRRSSPWTNTWILQALDTKRFQAFNRNHPSSLTNKWLGTSNHTLLKEICRLQTSTQDTTAFNGVQSSSYCKTAGLRTQPYTAIVKIPTTSITISEGNVSPSEHRQHWESSKWV